MNNKTAGHTPGPWHVGGRDSIIVYASDGFAIANATTFHGKHGGDDKFNARLIAAAPELLCALKDAEFLLRKAGQVGGPMQDSFNRSAHDARAAVAKAEGR